MLGGTLLLAPLEDLFYFYSTSLTLVKCAVCTMELGHAKHTFVWNLYKFIFACMFLIFKRTRYMQSKVKTNLHLFCLHNNFVSSENSMTVGSKPVSFTSIVNYWGGGKAHLAAGEACLCHVPSFHSWAFDRCIWLQEQKHHLNGRRRHWHLEPRSPEMVQVNGVSCPQWLSGKSLIAF